VTLAVQVTWAPINGPAPNTTQGILVIDPKVGHDCSIFLGGDQYLHINNIKGWIGLVNSNCMIVFDKDHKQFRLQVIGSSSDFT
jgi:hypothetical protein